MKACTYPQHRRRKLAFIFSFFMTIFLIVLLSSWLELVPGVDAFIRLPGAARPRRRDERAGGVRGGYETVNSGGIYVLNPKCPQDQPRRSRDYDDG
ncbi:MAG: hypothetical protein U0521_08605 [Anaerolineae bacterium]